MIDQPSQTQFADGDDDAEEEERHAVKKAFAALDVAIGRTHGKLQVIVSDHAGRSVIDDSKYLVVVERWRRGRKLIPWHWGNETLRLLLGKPADAALEDLSNDVLLPALLSELGIQASEYAGVSISKALFTPAGIEFIATVRLQQLTEREGTDGIGTRRFKVRKFRGVVQRDLSVSLEIIPD